MAHRQVRYRMLLDRFGALRDMRDGLVCLRWAWRSARSPFPPPIKRALLRDLAEKYRLDILVETGTFWGDTSADLARTFRQVYTVEAARELFDSVAPRFAHVRNVRRFHGDSGAVLSEILPLLDRPALFWLDAHVQGFEHFGELNPILREISLIAGDSRFGHVLAVDDMRLFGTAREYPTLEQLRAVIVRTGRRHQFAISGDIGVICFELADRDVPP